MLLTNQSLEKNKNHFLEGIRTVLDVQDLHLEDEKSRSIESNSLSIHRQVLGLGFPRTLEQLKAIVLLAEQFQISVYPVSQGKNIGYGESTPTSSNQFVINLKYLNSIREFDSLNGEVVIEPGVTQQQLCQFLAENNANFWADVTGASPDASIIGNTLEAGFGHTPLGDHRKHILNLEVLLANGKTLTTKEMPAIGPDLAQLFVQSNFGIVTAMRIPLFQIPEETITFAVAFADDDAFFKGAEILSALRRDGTINSLVHTANSTRTLMTSSKFPDELSRDLVLNESDCLNLLNTKSPIQFGAWSMIGGIYGFKSENKLKISRIKKAFKGVGRVKIFSDFKINLIDRILNTKIVKKLKSLNLVRKSFSSLKAIHRILRGAPSSVPSENIYWRVQNNENLGLMWFAPVIPATAQDAKILVDAARSVFATYRFEMPLTLTLINPKYLTAVFNISFDRKNEEETARAKKAYEDLSRLTLNLGYEPYRCGLLSKASQLYSPEQNEILRKVKLFMDPHNIFAPGRYGIGSK